MWTKCQIRTGLSIQIEAQRLDFEIEPQRLELLVLHLLLEPCLLTK